MAALAVASLRASDALAASTLSVDVSPPTLGTSTTAGRVAVNVATTIGDNPAALPPQLRTLAVSMPDGFLTDVADMDQCDAAALEADNPAACAKAQLGTASGSFAVVSGTRSVAAITPEVSIFHGTGEALLAYAKITSPIKKSVVLSGTLASRAAPAGPLLTLKLDEILEPLSGIRAVAKSATIKLTRGLKAGPCPAGLWTFGAQLDFVDAVSDQPTASFLCPLDLRASARNSTRRSGAHVAIVLSAPAKVKATLERRAGRRWVTVRSRSVEAVAGPTSLVIHSAHGHRLAAGRYRWRLKAVNAVGASATKHTRAFTLH